MMESSIDKKLLSLLKEMGAYDKAIDEILYDCATQEERQKLIDFIESKKPKLGKVLEYAAVFGIESGRSEGELEDCDDDYWDKPD